MSSKRKAEIFAACAKALTATIMNGRKTPAQIQSMKLGRVVLLGFIHGIAAGQEPELKKIEGALSDLHPRTEYSQALILRDLADMCLTLERLETGRKRSDEKKHLDATHFFQMLTHEFAAK